MRVAEPGDLGRPPAARLDELRDLVGREQVVQWCVDLLAGHVDVDDPTRPPLSWLGGGHAATELQRGSLAARGQDYWPRVWAARGLLHIWDPTLASVAVPVVTASLRDDAWRVREMAAKVICRWELAEAADALTPLVTDAAPRVRAAAVRALGVVGEAEHATALQSAQDDDDAGVRRAAGDALDTLAARIDRSDLTVSGLRSPRRPATSHRQHRTGSTSTGRPPPAPPGNTSRAPVTADDLDLAITGALAALRARLDRYWSVPAGGVRWSCGRTSVHIADDLVAYAAQLAARVPTGYLPFHLTPSRGTAPAGLLNLIEATGALLGTAVRTAPIDARGYHPWGMADAEGFAALGAAEVILHSHDIAAGLGVPYQPDLALCVRITARLFRDLPGHADPWTLLLWATGRADLPGHNRVRRWRWWPAPYDN